MNPHKSIIDYIRARLADFTLLGNKFRYEQSYSLDDLGGNDLVTKQHLTNATTPFSALYTLSAGQSLPYNINLSGFNLTARPTVIITMADTTTREKIIHDVDVFINFNTGKSQVTSIDILGHNNGSGVNLDDLFITIKQ